MSDHYIGFDGGIKDKNIGKKRFTHSYLEPCMICLGADNIIAVNVFDRL